MLLSVVFLKVKYQLLHIAGAGVCLLGIATLAYADIASGKSNKGVFMYVLTMCICHACHTMVMYTSHGTLKGSRIPH